MEYFISEKELFNLQHSHLYRDLPLAYIFFRELMRKRVLFQPQINFEIFYNFFSRFDDGGVEMMFADHSYLKIRFDEGKCYVIHPQRNLFKEFILA
ncbi:hypothetical protein MIS33_10835 [Wielerella bovis]|uniref:hypothetical protein n=1 Tax=Wielerella bovis TaxID=2917790 RepID=UPI00201A2043|nr:hypothetical protein [Wielerella bovis]ULJ64607.1 hypothetical protein MIS33_10835 [Wielerella bovis]